MANARPPVWLWFNLLGLDAPVVALVWQDFLARCYPTILRPPGRAVLGLTVWAIYLADRLLDTRHPAVWESVRHVFRHIVQRPRIQAGEVRDLDPNTSMSIRER